MRRVLIVFVMATIWLFPATSFQGEPALADVLNATVFRNIGPFRPSAWITDIAVPEAPLRDHLYTIYAATRSGGLWKTSNNGITWTPISDSVEVAAVGAVALAPSNPDVVWMGTGDQANARSSYSGKGVFKSIDAGQDVADDGSSGFPPHRAHPCSPDGSQCRVRGGDGSPVLSQRRARRLPDARWRQDVGQGPLRRRRDRGDRSRDEPTGTQYAVRRHVREAPVAVAARARREGERGLPQ